MTKSIEQLSREALAAQREMELADPKSPRWEELVKEYLAAEEARAREVRWAPVLMVQQVAVWGIDQLVGYMLECTVCSFREGPFGSTMADRLALEHIEQFHA